MGSSTTKTNGSIKRQSIIIAGKEQPHSCQRQPPEEFGAGLQREDRSSWSSCNRRKSPLSDTWYQYQIPYLVYWLCYVMHGDMHVELRVELMVFILLIPARCLFTHLKNTAREKRGKRKLQHHQRYLVYLLTSKYVFTHHPASFLFTFSPFFLLNSRKVLHP